MQTENDTHRMPEDGPVRSARTDTVQALLTLAAIAYFLVRFLAG